jgi:hypothetical protein
MIARAMMNRVVVTMLRRLARHPEALCDFLTAIGNNQRAERHHPSSAKIILLARMIVKRTCPACRRADLDRRRIVGNVAERSERT